MGSVAILCNNFSSDGFARPELVDFLRKTGNQPYCGLVFDGAINEYYSEKTAKGLFIQASRNNTNPFVELKSLNSVRKAIKSSGIDCAIVYGVKNHAAMAIGARLGGAKRVLCVVNGSGNLFRVNGFKGWLLRRISFPMLRIAYFLSCGICFQNSDDKELFIKKHLVRNNEKCFVTGGSGVNLDTFKPTQLPSENRFLFLSRITPSKGITEYIKAAAIVKEKYPDAIFDIVGPIDKAVENLDGLLLNNSVKAGIVNYHGATDDVPAWMSKCRFFVYPSYYPEGVPRCAIQAIACGRPIITCNTPGCKETVIDGVNGLIAEPRSADDLAQKMIWMLENPSAVEQMANKSCELAESKFDVNKINQELIDRLRK